MATVSLEGFEDLIRSTLKQGVDVFGFGGVLSLLADEASERADGDDESLEILDAIETAHETVNEFEEPVDDSSNDDGFEQEDYLIHPDDDEEEEESDNADDEN